MPLISLATLQARVYSRIDSNGLLYPVDEVNALVNEAVKILNVFTGLYQATVVINSQPNRTWYHVPQSLIWPSRVQYERTYLERSGMLQMGRSRPMWTTETTLNQRSSVTSWVPFGFRTIGIHPADSLGGHEIAITGCAEPPLLVNPSDTINLNNDYFAAFDEYVACTIVLKESPKTFSQASMSYNSFLKIIKKVTVFRSFSAPRYWLDEAQQAIKR